MNEKHDPLRNAELTVEQNGNMLDGIVNNLPVPLPEEKPLDKVREHPPKRVFSMFGGKQERMVIRFINPLLDAVVDRFGNDKSSVWYEKLDDKHFTVTTQVEISDQFFGWVLGFGKWKKLLEPPAVVDQFAAYLDKVREMY